jgi:hypothetical protein
LVLLQQMFRRLKRSGGLCDSPLERGAGVCTLGVNNTPLQPHHRRAPSQEGNFVSNILKNNQVMLNLFQHPIRTAIQFTDSS